MFPGMTLPLHIFEERYRHMVRCCLDGKDPRFVITLTRSQSPVGDTLTTLHAVGTFVSVLSITENLDGTYHLLTHGGSRCAVEITKETLVPEQDGTLRPLYFTSDIEVTLERGHPNQERLAAWDALETFRRYAEVFLASSASKQIDGALPEGLLYQASFICANIRVSRESRQVLLEAPSLTARFQLARKLMQERLAAHRVGRASGGTSEGHEDG